MVIPQILKKSSSKNNKLDDRLKSTVVLNLRLRATVQLARSAPAKMMNAIPINAIIDLPSGKAPNKGIAGILFNRNESGETKVPDPTANPTPEK